MTTKKQKDIPDEDLFEKLPTMLDKGWISLLSGVGIHKVAEQFDKWHRRRHHGSSPPAVEVSDGRHHTTAPGNSVYQAVPVREIHPKHYDLKKSGLYLKLMIKGATWQDFIEKYNKEYIQLLLTINENGTDDILENQVLANKARNGTINNEILEGRLVDVKKAAEYYNILTSNIRVAFNASENDLPPECVGKTQREMQQIIRKYIAKRFELFKNNPFEALVIKDE